MPVQKDARKANNPGFFDSVVNFGIHSFTGRDTETFDPNTMDGVDTGFDRVMASTALTMPLARLTLAGAGGGRLAEPATLPSRHS